MSLIINYNFDDDYKLIDKFNSSSFCKLWSCMKRSSGQKCNAKILNGIHKKIVDENIFYEINEIIIATEIKRHPYLLIMEVVYYEQQMGKIILITDFTVRTLNDMIKEKGVLTAYEIKLYTYQMLNGLQCLHKNGFVHRDIKPQKLWVTARDQCLKIGDFETTYRLADGSPYVGQDYAGTTQYRSPECLLSRGQCDTKTDVWSAGCVLYEMTIGLPLFDGVDAFDQLAKVDSLLGTPDRQLVDRFVKYRSLAWVERYAPGCCTSERAVPGVGLYTVYEPYLPAYDAFKNMIVYDPIERLSAKELLQQEYFLEMKNKENRLKPGCAIIPGKPTKRRRVFRRTKKISLVETHQSSINNKQAIDEYYELSFQRRIELNENIEQSINNMKQEPINFRLLEQQNYMSKEYAEYVKRKSSTKQKPSNMYIDNKTTSNLNVQSHNKDSELSVKKLGEREENMACCINISQKPVNACLLDPQKNYMSKEYADCTEQKSSTVKNLDNDCSENKKQYQLPKLSKQPLGEDCIRPKSSTVHISDNVHTENKEQCQLPKLSKQASGEDRGSTIKKRMGQDKNIVQCKNIKQKPVNPRLLNPQQNYMSKKHSNSVEPNSSIVQKSDNVYSKNEKQCQLPKLDKNKINISSKKIELAKISVLNSRKLMKIEPRLPTKVMAIASRQIPVVPSLKPLKFVVSNRIQTFSKPRVLVRNDIVKRNSHNQGPRMNERPPWR